MREKPDPPDNTDSTAANLAPITRASEAVVWRVRASEKAGHLAAATLEPHTFGAGTL